MDLLTVFVEVQLRVSGVIDPDAAASGVFELRALFVIPNRIGESS